MKKLFKRILAVCVSAVMAVSVAAVSVSAEETLPVDSEEYFSFVNPDSRIDSNGDFTFEVRWGVDSPDTFKFNSNKSTITVSAHIEDYITHEVSYDSHLCTLYLDTGFSRTPFDFYADGSEYTFSLVELSTVKNYSISISNMEELDSRHRVVGSGNISNITLN